MHAVAAVAVVVAAEAAEVATAGATASVTAWVTVLAGPCMRDRRCVRSQGALRHERFTRWQGPERWGRAGSRARRARDPSAWHREVRYRKVRYRKARCGTTPSPRSRPAMARTR